MSHFHEIFESTFANRRDAVDESVLDFPGNNTLSREVWDKRNGKYVPKDEVSRKAGRIIDWAVEKFSLKNPKARIVGSICSNTFSDSSDIDIHISADNITEGNAADFNKKLISAFKKKFVGKSEGTIGSHPFEIYAQPNLNQDIMSVGCYDLDNDKWLSGPEILDKRFNPYEKYYDGVQKHLDDISEEIRRHVLLCGEIASVIEKVSGKVAKNDSFLKRMEDELAKATKKSRELFNDVRKKRSVASSPKSVDEAKRKRVSREWKVADASFKFLDKLGYIATLLSIAKVGENDDMSAAEKAEAVIKEIHSNLFNKDRTGYADVDKD